MPDTCMDRGSMTHVSSHVSKSTFPIIPHINAQNRARIVATLFSVFSYLLGSWDKDGQDTLDWNCKVADRMIMRGFDHKHSSRANHRDLKKNSVSRIPLPSSVYLDMLNLAYYAMNNNYAVSDTRGVQCL